jgi:aminoglycoside phosphotransferase (APT) family kinase protein
VDDVLRAVLGAGARVVGALPGDGGAVVRHVVGPGGADLVVKTAPLGAGPDLMRSARAQRAAAGAGVPVPRLVAAEVRDGVQVHVTERVAGRRWCDVHPGAGDADRRAVQEALADVLERLRGVVLPGYGDLGAPGAPELDALLARTRARVPAGPRRAAAERVLDRHGPLFDGAAGAVLVHGDLHHANVLVRRAGDRWALAAVLDWDSAWAGPADADAARAALWDGMPSTPAGAGPRAAVQQLLWCLEYGDGGPRHRADTARVAARLGVRV